MRSRRFARTVSRAADDIGESFGKRGGTWTTSCRENLIVLYLFLIGDGVKMLETSGIQS